VGGAGAGWVLAGLAETGSCGERAGEIREFVSWRLHNLPEYRGWLREMLKAWGGLLNEANNQRSLLPFAAAALAHLGVGLVATYVVEGLGVEEALGRAEEDLCAVCRAARMLLREAFESGALLELVKEVQEELEKIAGGEEAGRGGGGGG
jgi:hypothetical protein